MLRFGCWLCRIMWSMFLRGDFVSVRKLVKRRDDGKPKLLNTTTNGEWVSNHKRMVLDPVYVRSLEPKLSEFLDCVIILYTRFGKHYHRASYDVSSSSRVFDTARRYRTLRRSLIDRISFECEGSEQFAISQVDILARDHAGITRGVQRDWDWFFDA